jgi:glycosyltransferase involved in cell wall biosynthesis
MSRISVLILTKNEERDLPGCLQSVRWCDDIHVLDSFSTDRTVEIARQGGASVNQRVFDGYASQRNFGLHEIRFAYPWVLMLDADERVPERLARALQSFVETCPQTVAAARLQRRDYWQGGWLRHSAISPFGIRLVRCEKVRYEREINELLQVDGEIMDMREHFDHFPFSKGIGHWIAKHNIYSKMEAEVIASNQVAKASLRKALFARDVSLRRIHQKAIFYRLPLRPVVKLAYMLLVRRAILDGMAGIHYSLLQAIYEYFIVLKTREIRHAQQVPPRKSAPSESD